MSELEMDKNNLQLALRCIEQIKKCVTDVRSKVDDNPESAHEFMRPSVCLMEKLLEVQTEVQGLIEGANRAELLAIYVGR